MYVEGRGLEQDLEKAKEHLKVVVDARIDGILEMQTEAMALLASFSEDNPLQEAHKFLNAPRGTYSIEQIYEQSHKISQYLEMAEAQSLFFKLYQLQASMGDRAAQYQLGYWYLNGYYTEVNYEEAAYWIQKAADQKDEYAEAKIAYMYEKGLYFNKDLNIAKKWYERSLRRPAESLWPEYIHGSLNPEYLYRYEQMNKDALEGLVRIEAQIKKPSKWKFWQK